MTGPIAPTVPIPSVTSRSYAVAQAKAREFESVFLGQMTKLMMEAATADGDVAGGHGEEMFRGVLAEQIGTAMTAAGGIGLTPLVRDQIIRLQGGITDDR